MVLRNLIYSLVAGAVCSASCGIAFAAPPVAGNWTNTFDEEFSSSINTARWKYQLWNSPNIGFGQEVYRSSGVSVSNGVASLTASKQTAAGHDYVSGMINTGPQSPGQATGYSFLYGYAEARMKLVSGQGLWPAFWMLPDPNPAGAYHDGDGEIDVMEELGHQTTLDEIHYHHGADQWGGYVDTGVDLSQAFHTYGVNWKPGELDYYLDGSLIYTIDQAPSVAEYLIFDLAVGSSTTWPGAPDANTVFPASMQVDSVQVWQNVPEPGMGWIVVGGMLCRRWRMGRGGEAVKL